MAELRKNAFIFKGPVDLEGPQLKAGDRAPNDFTLTANDLSPVPASQLAGKPRIVITVPSLDTSVCDLETRRFNEEAAKLSGLSVWAVSMDLPFAQKRWCGAAGIKNVRTVSDYKSRSFGPAFGVWIPAVGLLSRAVFVIDGKDTVRHVEYVKEVGLEPDYKAALDAAKAML